MPTINIIWNIRAMSFSHRWASVSHACTKKEWTISTTRPGEIPAGAEFYTYDDKYKNGVSQTVIPAHLSEEKLDEVRTEARKAYLALGCSGLSRCDFFVERGTGRVLCNELNTLPGFTSISMYPKLMEHEGYSYPALVDRLLTLAAARRKGAY